MASTTYLQHYANGTSEIVRRSAKQGRKPSPDRKIAITVRLYSSWIAEMDNPREEIEEAVRQYRTRKLLKS